MALDLLAEPSHLRVCRCHGDSLLEGQNTRGFCLAEARTYGLDVQLSPVPSP